MHERRKRCEAKVKRRCLLFIAGKNKCGRGKLSVKVDLLRDPPVLWGQDLCRDWRLYSFYNYVEIFWIFYIAAAIRCQQRNLAKRQTSARISNTLFSACSFHSSAQFSSWHCHLPHWSFDVASICLRHLWREQQRAPAFFSLCSTFQLQRRIHDGICSKYIINILSLHGKFFFFSFSNMRSSVST